MSGQRQSDMHHDIKAIATQFPELAVSVETSEANLRQLEAKYKILLQIADQSLRDRELTLKEATARVDRWSNPLMVGVMVGALGLIGSFINGVWSNRNQQLQLENQNRAEEIKLQNDLIKEAIKPADEQERAKSLVFFAKNNLIRLDSTTIERLVKIVGSESPIPGSSGSSTSGGAQRAQPISFTQAMVDRIRNAPGVPYPTDVQPVPHLGDARRKAIILHDAIAGDGSVALLRDGMSGQPGLPGPLAHWVVQSDGTIAFIADETEKANHVGNADRGLSNFNTIGISVTGLSALSDDRQTENLIRLVVDVANRWGIPTNNILSHAEVALPRGRKEDMRQQAPAIREMVDAVRKSR
jgi:hypothetical protein